MPQKSKGKDMPYKDKNKQKAYQKAWVANRRKYAIICFGGKCKICSSLDKLHFDHVDPKTKVSHNIWSWSSERLREELIKCQLLCKDCHLKKTMKENNLTPVPHGHIKKYKIHRCKCALCRKANANNKREREHKRKNRGVTQLD